MELFCTSRIFCSHCCNRSWFQIIHKHLGAQLLSLFVEAEGSKFHSRLSSVLPIISAELSQLRDQNYIISGDELGPVKETGLEELAMDQLLFLLLSAVRKICEHCPSVLRTDVESTEWMNQVWGKSIIWSFDLDRMIPFFAFQITSSHCSDIRINRYNWWRVSCSACFSRRIRLKNCRLSRRRPSIVTST